MEVFDMFVAFDKGLKENYSYLNVFCQKDALVRLL